MSAYFSIALTTEKKNFYFHFKVKCDDRILGFFFVVNLEIE